jgi:hypothetical protein
MKTSRDGGSVLMEFVIILPLLCFFIFGLMQLALLCLAKQMTEYAAFSGARAAMVYPPSEYCGEDGRFMAQGGVVHEAASRTLAWFGMMPGGEHPVAVAGWGDVPGSGHIGEQVFIDQEESGMLSDMPGVRVTVRFRYPLLIPGVSALYRLLGHDDALTDESLEGLVETLPAMTVVGTCMLPLPWRTDRFPTRPTAEN